MGITAAHIAAYKRDGFISGLAILSPEEAASAMASLAAYEAEVGPTEALHMKSHIYFSWLWKIARNPRLIEAVTGVTGPDILVLASRLWIKNPADDKYVSWHQDVNYFGIEPSDVSCNIWLALTHASEQAGCMRFMPGSHKSGLIEHEITMDAKNLLTRGQTVQGVDISKSVTAPLRPGECSIHHGHVLHCSPPNLSDHRRIGFSMILLPAHVRSTTGRRSATLLCGEDKYGHWDLDPEPQSDRDPAIFARMHQETKRYVPERA